MRYNKLVRDNIPEIIRAKGGEATTHIAGDAEYWEKLKEKLTEEVLEFSEAESIEELADMLEVIDAIVVYQKFDTTDIEQTKREKAQKSGTFEKRIILEQS